MIGISTGLRFLSQGGTPVTGGGVTVPDDPGGGTGGTGGIGGGGGTTPTLASLPMVASARWHPGFSSVTLAGDRVIAATDLAGLADLTGDPATAPQALTDGLGRAFWRFDGAQFLTAAPTLSLGSRNMAVFFVGRFHRVTIKSAVFSLGSVAAGTASNISDAMLGARRNAGGMPMLQTAAKPSISAYPTPDMMVAGSQMQVAGMAGRVTAAGGTGLWLNDTRLNTTQHLDRPGVAGAEIGRYAYSPGAAGAWGVFDLYEMVVYDHAVTDTEGDALSAALMAHYQIPAIQNQLVLEGDSIMQGTDPVTPALSAGMVLTTPGVGHIGADWRVVNIAQSGNETPDLIARRDTVLGWPGLKVPGRNVLAFEIGRNDLATTYGGTPTTLRADVLSYLTGDVAGTAQSVLDYGWEVRVMANIASGPDFETPFTTYRAMLRDPAFANDTGTHGGGPHAGQLQIVDTETVTLGGNTVFATVSDAQDVTYYVGDSTHPNIAGAAVRVTGGDNPAKGVAYGLT